MVYTFQRVEKKYLLNKDTYDSLLKRLGTQIVPDLYHKSTICNIYFDNDNNDLIRKSLDKPLYKEKLRLRSYDTPTINSLVFFEIKKKYKGVVSKRRITLKLEDFYKYKYNKKPKSQIEKEISYFFDFYNVHPSLFLAYDRLSYKGLNDSSLRITFDKNVRSRNDDLNLEKGSQGKLYFDNDECIMEIKVSNSIPIWLANILSELKIYPTSFSKYGKIYEKERMKLNV